MNRAEFTELMEARFDWLRSINDTKGSDYAGGEDVLANIKRTAARCGLTTRQVVHVFLTKHLDAIDTYVQTGELKSEEISNRTGDVMFYMLLLEADSIEVAGVAVDDEMEEREPNGLPPYSYGEAVSAAAAKAANRPAQHVGAGHGPGSREPDTHGCRPPAFS